MDLFDATKSIVENASFLSGPILALLGFFIFRQIVLAKQQLLIAKEQLKEAQKQLAINSSRDSIKLAAEQVRFYMDTIVSNSNQVYDKLKELGIERVKIDTIRFTKEDIYSSPNLKEILEYLKKTKDISFLDLKVINALEIFSTYFVQKVADEKVAFQSVGKSFCGVIEDLSVLYSTCREKDSDYFENTLVLYRLWKNRLNQQNLEAQKAVVEKELSAKIQEIETKLKSTPKSNISPLGTD